MAFAHIRRAEAPQHAPLGVEQELRRQRDRAPAGTSTQQSWLPLIMYVLGAIVFATVWCRFFRRGPLEYLLNAATKPAKHIR